MKYQVFAPPPSLTGIVRFFWVFEMDGIEGDPYIYRSMADGCAELVFHYRGDFSEVLPYPDSKRVTSKLHAQTGKYRRFLTHQNFGIFGAYIFPHALPQLFGYNSAELSDEMPDLIALAGESGRVLEERILTANTDIARVDLLTSWLQQRFKKGQTKDIDAAKLVQSFIQLKGKGSIKDFSSNVGISMRSQERRFKEYAGFSPKKLSRILRFQAAVEKYGSISPNLPQLALECGYFDQSHFSHEFKKFSGYTPGSYFGGQPEGAEYKEL